MQCSVTCSFLDQRTIEVNISCIFCRVYLSLQVHFPPTRSALSVSFGVESIFNIVFSCFEGWACSRLQGGTQSYVKFVLEHLQSDDSKISERILTYVIREEN